MSTNEPDRDRQQAEDILSNVLSASAPHTTDEQSSTRQFIDVHIYELPADDEWEEPCTVESDSAPDHTEATCDTGAQPAEEQDEPVSALSRTTRTRRMLPIAIVGALCIVGLLVMAGVQLLPIILTPVATITIVPVSVPISTTSSITIGGPEAQVPGRSLATLTMSQARTIPSTGKGHQEARAARGFITFYNASLREQVVFAGTVLATASGIQVVTEQDAVIPAGTLATNGHSTVAAHIVVTGAQGNLPAGAIYGACCRVNVFAASGAFTGGQAARDYPMVTQADIDDGGQALTTSLIQSATLAMQGQVHADETLIMPLVCAPHVTADHQPGDEAAQVSITVDETCQGQTYQTQALHDVATRLLTQAAIKQLGAGYGLMGMVQTTVRQARGQGSMTRLDLTSTGTWSYQFSEDQVQSLKALVAGKSQEAARTRLLHTAGVQQVSISLPRGETVPTETSKIVIVWLNYGS